MAKGNWRNWEEVYCPKCAKRYYKKQLKLRKGKYYCEYCGNELKEGDLPFIRDDSD